MELRKIVNRIYPLTFTELTVGPDVKNARHAISVDDERLTFHPELWNEQHEKDDRVLQVWFPGVHSNVGGGYPKQGMSLVALDWMMAEAEACGLRFIRHDRHSVRRHYDPHDKLYDSRASLAIYYRWQPRSIVELCTKHKMGKPKIHVSVFERIANGTDGYAPGNIPYDCELVTTQRAKSAYRWPNEESLRRIASILRSDGRDGWPTSPLEENKQTVQSGLSSYRTFIAASLFAAIMLLYAAVRQDLFMGTIILIAFAVIGLLVRRWAERVDARLNSTYAKRWNKHRADLRKLLRTDLAEEPSSESTMAVGPHATGNGSAERREPVP
jgi:hypothetical protein